MTSTKTELVIVADIQSIFSIYLIGFTKVSPIRRFGEKESERKERLRRLTERGDVSQAEYRERAKRLLYEMVFSMVVDAENKKRPSNDTPNPKILRTIARRHLREFRDWPVYVRAMNCGMDFPNEAQVERYLKRGMVTRRRRFYIKAMRSEKRRGTVVGLS